MENRKMEVRSSTFVTSVQSTNEDLLNTGDYSDVVLVAGGHHFNLHKSILATRDYFRAMFSSGMKETEQNEITIQDIQDKQIMKTILQYIYCGVTTIDGQSALDLLYAADMLGLADLKEDIEKSHVITFDDENWLNIMSVAQRLSCCHLLRECFEFFNGRVVYNCCESKQFLSLDIEQLKIIIADPKLNVASEDEACKLIMRWLENDAQHRVKHVSLAFTFIRLYNLSMNYLSTLIDDPLLVNCVDTLNLLKAVKIHLQRQTELPENIPLLPRRTNMECSKGIVFFGHFIKHDREHDNIFLYRHNIGRFMPEVEDTSVLTGTAVTYPVEYDVGNVPRGDDIDDEVYVHNVSCCAIQETIYVSGFSDQENDVFEYDVQNGRWKQEKAFELKRINHCLVVGYDHQMFAVGGNFRTNKKVVNLVPEIEKFVLDENRCTTLGELSQPLYSAGSVFYQKKLYIFGGYLNEVDDFNTGIQVFDTETKSGWILKAKLATGMFITSNVIKHTNKAMALVWWIKPQEKLFLVSFNLDKLCDYNEEITNNNDRNVVTLAEICKILKNAEVACHLGITGDHLIMYGHHYCIEGHGSDKLLAVGIDSCFSASAITCKNLDDFKTSGSNIRCGCVVSLNKRAMLEADTPDGSDESDAYDSDF